MTIRFLAPLAILALTSCLSAGPDCTPAPSPAFNVTVVDAATGAFLAAGASGVAIDGSFEQALTPGDFAGSGARASLYGPLGRAGRYTVVVRHPGYQEWRREGVNVSNGRCGVETVPLRAELQAS